MIAYIVMALVVLGFGGLVAYIVLRQKKKKEDYNKQFNYTTKHGIRVKLSDETAHIPASDFEEWTEDVVNFWFEAKGYSKEKSMSYMKKISIFMHDKEHLNRAGMKVNGILWPSKFEIECATLPRNWVEGESSQTPYKRVKSLFRHEVSHVIAGYVGKVKMTNEVHHALFAEVGLGA